MKAKDIMSKQVFTTTRDAALASAAKAMKEHNIGMLAVLSHEGAVVGTITDRDIAVRAVARGLEPNSAKVEEAMTKGCESCLEEDSLDDVARRMSEKKLRRVVVMSRDKKTPAGVVSLDDLAAHKASRPMVGDVLFKVASR